jgi:hypothetical protein
MALVVADRVQETTNTTGTGTLTLAGAVSGYQSFSVIGNTNTTYYTIVSGTSWETGIGTYTLSGTTLSRDTVLASSASGSKITVAAGAVVFCSYPAGKSFYLDASGNAIGLGTPAAFVATNVTGLPISTGVSGLGTGVATALGVNTGSTGAFVVNGGALGTPSGGTVTNLTGTASININGTVGATTPTTGAFSTVSATGVITSTLATGTAPFTIASTTQVANLNAATAGTATSATTATNLASGALGSVPYQNAAGTTLFLAGTTSTTPSFVTSTGTGTLTQAPTLTSSTGTGSVVLATSPTLVTPVLGTPASGVVTNLTGTASININGTVGATTPAAGTFTQLTVNGSNLNTAISPTGTGTVTISPAGALTINPTAASTINNTSIGATTASTGRFTSITATTGTITPATGTASVAPISLTSGTNLTSAVAGAIEYDGAVGYFTPDTTIGRGFIPSTSTFRLTAAGGAITTIANVFGTTSNIPLLANAFYEIDIYILALKTTAGAVTVTLTNSAAPTLMFVDYEQSPLSGVATPPGSVTALTNINFRGTTTTTTAAYNFATGTLATGVNHYLRFKLFLNNGTGTSLKIQLTSGTGSVTPQAGSVWFARRLPGANTGTFAA